jgi:hypothetical protein
MWRVLYHRRPAASTIDEQDHGVDPSSSAAAGAQESALRSGEQQGQQQEVAHQHQHRRLQSSDLMDLVDLQDFNIQLARVDTATPIQVYELTDLVTSWLNDSFERQLVELKYQQNGPGGGKYADFNSVMLLERKDGRRAARSLLSTSSSSSSWQFPTSVLPLQLSVWNDHERQRGRRLLRGSSSMSRGLADLASSGSQGQLFTAEFKGAALFSRNATQEKVPVDVVHFLQETALNNKTGLLELVQLSGAAGLGSAVVDLNAFTVAGSSGTGSPSSDSSLEAIIIVAVAVAAVAFLFLLVAIFWAWRYDRRNRQAYLASNASKEGTTTRRSMDPTHSQSSTIEEHLKRTKPVPVAEIVGESRLYPESVISEDISTSLSQYYRSGMSYANSASIVGGAEIGGPAAAKASSRDAAAAAAAAAGTSYGRSMGGQMRNMEHLNDAASVSSMESYGYSLDGYAPSTATPMPRDGVNNSSSATGGPLASRARREYDTDDNEDATNASMEEEKF